MVYVPGTCFEGRNVFRSLGGSRKRTYDDVVREFLTTSGARMGSERKKLLLANFLYYRNVAPRRRLAS